MNLDETARLAACRNRSLIGPKDLNSSVTCQGQVSGNRGSVSGKLRQLEHVISCEDKVTVSKKASWSLDSCGTAIPPFIFRHHLLILSVAIGSS